MRQINPGPYSLILPTLDPPVTVPPGGVIDHPEPLAGFDPVPDEAPAAPEKAAPSKPAPVAASPAVAATDAKEA